ncbi:twin-arginine translocation signal domain-containing protein [Halomicroarcula limicola]|uniref:Twin-arginine translocation signal domain-containing protein n=1 Tax=Haloarcula limicola TaxID=1429915 RepID=A0A8J7YDH6_9EURY|nr:ABC transporter substrate-binding protein [Halomicroarcula limicola]MBV0924488.1 twin-arginine translocation signal domain-containing protein [Halomicroarcula limicola]
MSRDSTSRRQFLKAAGAVTVTATSTAGCASFGGGGDGGGTLIYSRGDHPTNYDPQQTTSGEVAKVTNQVFDTTIDFKPGSGGKLVDGLAKEWELDGKTTTLTLKEGITFHGGDELTAEDVRATVRRFIDTEYEFFLGEKRSGYSSVTFGDWVESVEATSKYEVTFTLKQRYAPFVRNLAMFAAAILSKSQIEEMGQGAEAQAELGTDPRGTGPFQFEELDNSNEKIRFSAYDDYWGEGPHVSQLIMKTIKSNQTRAQDLINGDSHITDNLGAQAIKQIKDSDAASVKKKNGINVGYMAFNQSRKAAFRKPKVRRAISYAVDTEAIVNSIYQGFAKQADQALPPDVLGHNEDLDPYPHDPEKAQTLLEEAGETDLEFELATFSNPRGYNPSPVATANQIRSNLEDIGLSVSVNQFSSFGPYIDYTYAGKHDAALLGWYTDNADPDNFLYVLLHPGVPVEEVPDGQSYVSWDKKGNASNISSWANREYMKLVNEGQKTYDEQKREEIYLEAAKMTHEQAPWVFLDYAQLTRGINQAVQADSYTVSSVGGPYLELVQMN